MKEFTFKDGCMWEGGEWTIVIEHKCSSFSGGNPCKHCYDEKDEVKPDVHGGSYTEHTWICPSVVIAKNEGGCNSTGMCLQCIFEAAASMELKFTTISLKTLQKS